MKLKHLFETINTQKIEFDYEGNCVKHNIPVFYDATTLSNTIADSQLIKPGYLELTNIPEVAPKMVQKYFTNKKDMVIGFKRNFLWIYFNHVDKHFFFLADKELKIPSEFEEHSDLDRGLMDN